MNAEGQVKEMLDAYSAAIAAKNVDTFVSLYCDDVIIFDAWGSWSVEGKAAWKKMATDWFQSLGSELLRVTFADVQVIYSNEVASLRAFVGYTAMSAEGKEIRSMSNRLTWVLRQAESGWQIWHEHTSAPADFETGKVMLKRE